MINQALHNQLITYANHLGCGCYSEDVVQEAYLKILELGKEVNKSYIYLTVRSIAFDLHRANKNVTKLNIDDCINTLIDEVEPRPINVKDYASKLTKFENMLVDVVATKKISQRKLAEESTISIVTINRSIKRIRTKIINEWQKNEVEAWEIPSKR